MSRAFLNMTYGVLIALPFMVFAPSTQAMSNKPVSGNIGVTCQGQGPTALHTELCDSLRDMLAATYPNSQFTAGSADGGLDLTLQVTQANKTSVTAYLAWSGTASGRGSETTAGIRGADIGRAQYDMLSQSLLKITKLPLSSI